MWSRKPKNVQRLHDKNHAKKRTFNIMFRRKLSLANMTGMLGFVLAPLVAGLVKLLGPDLSGRNTWNTGHVGKVISLIYDQNRCRGRRKEIL